MNLAPPHVDSLLGAFLLAFPALFSIVNPMGSSLIFKQVTAGRTHSERRMLAGRIAFLAGCILLGSLWMGSYVLGFFGISIGALRVAGGLVVAISAWGLLNEPEKHEDLKPRMRRPRETRPTT